MKAKQIQEELHQLTKDLGIKIRRESGKFKSGWCIVNDNKLILINRTAPPEMVASVVAKCLAMHNLDNVFIKPAIREFIDNERSNLDPENEFKLEVSY